VAERRVCSVLFCDVVGFTPLSESRDPEAVRELLSRYFEIARTVIGRYGGVVEKFIGDAVMAVWGTPVAAEGDAERAVRAGLDLVTAVADLGAEAGVAGLAARCGLVTGEVAVTLGAVGEGMVAGDAVNTAARVQAAATPGSVLVDGATQRLAERGVGFADAGEHALKGKAEPQHLWRAVRLLADLGGAQRVDGLEAPLIGRDAELRTVKEQFHVAAERRVPRLVLVAGPAGVGKSRLGWEFEKYVDGLVDDVCGTGAGACPMGTGWRFGRWPRLSASGWASPRKTPPRLPRGNWRPGWTGSSPTLLSGRISACGWGACSVSSSRRTTAGRWAARSCSRGGGCSWSGSPRRSRWCCWSRTLSTPTPACWISWII
jgi:class 3 adenylate cyclase